MRQISKNKQALTRQRRAICADSREEEGMGKDSLWCWENWTHTGQKKKKKSETRQHSKTI